MSHMTTHGDPDNDLSGPDLARLLVLEAGRVLEELTPTLALRLSDNPNDRAEAIRSSLATLDRARALLNAAHSGTRLAGESKPIS